MQLTGSQVIIECLKEQGVDTVFGYPGGAILNVLMNYTNIRKSGMYLHRMSRGLPMQQTDMPEVQEKSESVWQQADREPPIW